MSNIKNHLIGLSTMLFLFITSALGTVFIMGPAIPLLLYHPGLFRRYNDFMIQIWLALPGAFFELLRGTKLTIYGSKIPPKESCLIIMNHRCRLDWMFYWMFLLRFGSLSQEKILMRNDLKSVPGAGWAMQNVLYLFLRRRWDQDEGYMNRILDYFIDISYPIQLLLFPEGTNYGRAGCAKSDEYAVKNGLPRYKYCLHPRVRGFNFIVQKLRSGAIQAIHDVTVAYPKGVCHGELNLLKGEYPREVLFHIDRYDIDSIPENSKELDQWCIDRWKEKEERLRKIYEENIVPDKNSEISLEDCEQANVHARRTYVFVLFFWVVFVTAAVALLHYFLWVRLLFITLAVFYTVQIFIFGGMDEIQLRRHISRKKSDSDKHS